VDISGLPQVEIYDLARLMAQQSGEPLVLWLHRFVARGLLGSFTGMGGRIDDISDMAAAYEILTTLAEPPTHFDEERYFYELDRRYPLKRVLAEVSIDRDVFRAWCLAAGYPPPAFWFGEQPATAPRVAAKGRGKTDAMAAEIDEILRGGTPATVEAVWRELAKRCGNKGSSCLNVEETDRGPVIVWRGHGGKLGRLTKRALEGRLSR